MEEIGTLKLYDFQTIWKYTRYMQLHLQEKTTNQPVTYWMYMSIKKAGQRQIIHAFMFY
jgi:hypothetical protein